MPKKKAEPVDKPKQPLNAFALYVQEVREENKFSTESESGEGWAKQCTIEWNNMPEKIKQKYKDQAAVDKEKYNEDVKLWKSNGGVERPPQKKKRKAEFPNLKRPSTAYIFFCNDKRPELKQSQPELSMVEMSKELGQMWRLTEDCDKEKYYKQANEDQMRYRRELIHLRSQEEAKKKEERELEEERERELEKELEEEKEREEKERLKEAEEKKMKEKKVGLVKKNMNKEKEAEEERDDDENMEEKDDEEEVQEEKDNEAEVEEKHNEEEKDVEEGEDDEEDEESDEEKESTADDPPDKSSDDDDDEND